MIKLTSQETCSAVDVMQGFGSMGGKERTPVTGSQEALEQTASLGSTGTAKHSLNCLFVVARTAKCEVIARSPETSAVIDQ